MLGSREVRLTRVYTVHTARMTEKHNHYPNWNYGAANSSEFNLIIEAEGGTDTVGFPYVINIYAMDWTTGNLNPVHTNAIPSGTVGGAGAGWTENISTQQWTRQWIVPIGLVTTGVLVPRGDGGRLIQYYVTMIDVTSNKVASYIISEPVLLI
jgi:hypothetical protein